MVKYVNYISRKLLFFKRESKSGQSNGLWSKVQLRVRIGVEKTATRAGVPVKPRMSGDKK